jgi:hypothetical protein
MPPDAPALPVLGEEPKLVAPDAADERYWSVTTIIGCLDKPALVPWAAIKTAEAAVDKLDTVRSILDSDGRDEAIRYLKNARFRVGKGLRSASELGKAVHAAAEYKAIHGRYRPEDANDRELRPFLVQFDRFLDEFQPEYIAAEVTVFSPTFGYAGTCDGFLRIGGTDYVVDYKSSREDVDGQGKLKAPFPEVGLQLAGYRHADIAAIWRARQAEVFKRRYYLLSESERELAVPVPSVDHGLAILLTPTRFAVHPVRCDEDIFELFLHCIDAARFVLDVGRTIVGNALIPPTAFHDATDDPFAGLPT